MGDHVFQHHLLGQKHDVSRTSSLVIIINISLHALSCWPAKTLRGGVWPSRPRCKDCMVDWGCRWFHEMATATILLGQ